MPMTATVTAAPTTSATAPHHGSSTCQGLSTRQGPAAAQALAAYPHISRCERCLRYAQAALDTFSVTATLQASLAHHESDHRHDSLLAASEYFGIGDTLVPDTDASI
jgi:hypothetical protein